jgi:superfamily I DNA/RNA helicase
VSRAMLSHVTPAAITLVLDAFRIRMTQVRKDESTWAEVCDEFEARNAVPLMTVHKSKSLEYHTVFFLSIDDNQWWAHRRERHESTATFFVGLSRAKQRTIFTYCDRRGDRESVADLYELLREAGVPEHNR